MRYLKEFFNDCGCIRIDLFLRVSFSVGRGGRCGGAVVMVSIIGVLVVRHFGAEIL